MKTSAAQQSLNIAFLARWSWFDRLFSILGFKSSRSIRPPTQRGTPSTPIPLVPKSAASSPKEMHTSTVSAVARIPLIKFLGARLPRPNYTRGPMPSIPISGNISAAPLAAAKATSIGPVGKIPRGQGIAPSQLPKKFQRPMISQEECDAINAGGSYGI